MKLMDIFKNYCGVGVLIASLTTVAISSCTEDIDESDLYTFTGEMMIDHFANNPEIYSSYLEILGMVHPSKHSPSTMHELLAARGKYTCFAPTNEAIEIYLDSLYKIKEVESLNVSEIPDSVAEDIVFNSIIENEAYESVEFNEGALGVTNMNDRYIDISTIAENGQTILMVNSDSRIVHKDVEVENGYIHGVDRVLAPSKSTIGELILATPNTVMFGKLLELTGWNKKVSAYRDEAYEDKKEAGVTKTSEYNTKFSGKYPEHRYYGYTIFVEPDEVFKQNGIGVNLGDDFVTDLMKWLKDNAAYDQSTSWGNDYTDENNALNQFVAYHIIAHRMTYDKLVIYSNEKGYNNRHPNENQVWKVNVWDYYETIGKHRRSVKITGSRLGKRLNRYSIYRTSTKSDSYIENTSLIPEHLHGLTISQINEDTEKNVRYKNQAINGYYYLIDGMHVWHEDIPNKVLNERMRYDVCSMLPEMMTNNCRYNKDINKFFTKDYFDNIINMTDQTEFLYLPNTGNEGGHTWMNYQTDEFNINGVYDFTMKLPPVPLKTTYEIRYGLNINGNRGMAQVYFGENPNNLSPIGIPLDLRLANTLVTGWVSDDGLSADEIEENDKAMRNNGYMKGPKYFWTDDTHSGRSWSDCLRCIIYTGDLEPGKTYYIRFKSVLESTKTEFVFDYLEFVPKSVYNGEVAEDKW